MNATRATEIADEPVLLRSDADGIATLTLNRPAPRNALSAALLAAVPAEPIGLHPDNPHYLLWRGKPTVLITSGEHYGAVLNVDFDCVRYLDAIAADRFYIVRHGAVALENASVERGVLTIQTFGRADALGISWLVPPFRHHNDARATGSARLVAFDARCLRDKCDQDHDLGYALMRRFLPLFAERLKQAELQLMDVYNVHR